MRLKLALASGLAVLAVSAVGVGQAGAAVTFGSAMLGEPTAAPCATISEPQSCTYAIGALPLASQEIGGAVAPSAGVVTSWKVKAGPPNPSATEEPRLRLRVLRGNTGVATGRIEELPLGKGIYTYITRLPVQTGDRVGLDLLNVQPGEAPPVAKTTTDATTEIWIPPLADGASLAPNAGTNDDYELLLQAVLEPDADKDGWGDETQDKCKGSAGANEGCPAAGGLPIPTEAVPDTLLGKKGTKGTSTTRKATFRFSSTVQGATFQCKLDKKPWKACKSPKIYRSLKEGRHTFKVKAVGPTAVPDPTPAKRSFKVEL